MPTKLSDVLSQPYHYVHQSLQALSVQKMDPDNISIRLCDLSDTISCYPRGIWDCKMSSLPLCIRVLLHQACHAQCFSTAVVHRGLMRSSPAPTKGAQI